MRLVGPSSCRRSTRLPCNRGINLPRTPRLPAIGVDQSRVGVTRSVEVIRSARSDDSRVPTLRRRHARSERRPQCTLAEGTWCRGAPVGPWFRWSAGGLFALGVVAPGPAAAPLPRAAQADGAAAPEPREPRPPLLPADFQGTGRYVVRDLGIDVPFRWQGRDGNSQMIAGGPEHPIWFDDDLREHALHAHLQVAEHPAVPAARVQQGPGVLQPPDLQRQAEDRPLRRAGDPAG